MKPCHILRTCFPLAPGRFEDVLSSQAALEQACPGLPMETIHGFIDRLASLHPWEHRPVELLTAELRFPKP